MNKMVDMVGEDDLDWDEYRPIHDQGNQKNRSSFLG